MNELIEGRCETCVFFRLCKYGDLPHCNYTEYVEEDE